MLLQETVSARRAYAEQLMGVLEGDELALCQETTRKVVLPMVLKLLIDASS